MSKKIVVLDNGHINQFGIWGPLTTPTVYSDSVVLSLIKNGHAVYEVADDGTRTRLYKEDFIFKPAEKKAAPAPAPAKVEKVEKKPEPVVETRTSIETPIVESAEVYDGSSATTAPVMPEKVEEQTPATTSKSQRKAQKKAKLAAKAAEEAKASEEAETEEKAE